MRTIIRKRNIADHSEESYEILILECRSSISALTPVATQYDIEIPDMEDDGETILYCCMQEGTN